VVDVVRRLTWLGHRVTVHDPLADRTEAEREYGLRLDPDALDRSYDVVVFAVPHPVYREMDSKAVTRLGRPEALIADLHGIWRDREFRGDLDSWTL